MTAAQQTKRWLEKDGYKTIWADAWGWFVWGPWGVTHHKSDSDLIAFAKSKGMEVAG
jgi:hypothetical protein